MYNFYNGILVINGCNVLFLYKCTINKLFRGAERNRVKLSQVDGNRDKYSGRSLLMPASPSKLFM